MLGPSPISYTPPQPVTIAPWLQPLVQRESGGRWDVVNPYGYSGIFQFGEAAAAQAGVYGGDDNLRDNRWGGTFTLPSGRYSYQEWLNSPQAQIETGDAHFGGLDRELERLGLSRYLGQTVNGVPVTREGLLYGAHLGGLGGLKRWLEGRGNPADANGTRVGDYVAMGAQAGQAPAMAMAMAPQAGGGEMAGPTGGLLGMLAPGAMPPPQRRGLLDMLLYGDEDGIGMQAGLNAAAALLEAGAPSTDPRSGSFGYALGQGLRGLGRGQMLGMAMAEQNRMADARAQMEGMIASLPPEVQGLARMDPAGFARIMMEQQFAGPQVPNTQGLGEGWMWDTSSGTPRAVPIPGYQAQPDMPSAVQEYQFAVQQGYPGTFADWEMEQRRAGATTVNVGGTPQTTWQAGAEEIYLDQYKGLLDQASAAREMLGLLDQASQALDTNVYTGFGGNQIQMWNRIATSLGIGDEEITAAGDILTAVQNRLALIMRSPDGGAGMPGAVSDRDLEFLRAAQPGLDKTPEANRMMIEMLRRLETRKLEIAELADRYIASQGQLDGGFNAVVRQFAESNPLFAGMEAPAAPQEQEDGAPTGMPQPQSAQEYDALPPGTTFVAPDGTIRVKP